MGVKVYGRNTARTRITTVNNKRAHEAIVDFWDNLTPRRRLTWNVVSLVDGGPAVGVTIRTKHTCHNSGNLMSDIRRRTNDHLRSLGISTDTVSYTLLSGDRQLLLCPKHGAGCKSR